MVKTSNGKCRELVERQIEFTANNIYSQNIGHGKLYVVYSYGVHFPMYVFDSVANVWYKNADRYSVTTSKHKGQACPFTVNKMIESDTQKLRDLIDSMWGK